MTLVTSESGAPRPAPQDPLLPGERERLRLLSAIVAASAEAIFTLTDDLRVGCWNPAAADLYGVLESEIQGASIDRIMSAVEASRLRALVTDVLHTGRVLRTEAVHRTREGGLLHMRLALSAVPQADGGPAAVAVIAQDITARAQEEARLRLTVEQSPVGLLMVDPHGRITAVNGAAEELFGFPREELLGEPVELLLPESRRAAHATERAAFHSAPAHRRMTARNHLMARRRDGTEFPVDVGLSPVVSPEGPMVLASVTDATERQQAALAERKQRQDLVRSNEALEHFAAIASHDLREPLRTIASYSHLLAERYRERLDPPADRYLRHIEENASRMQQMVSDLLRLSRVEADGRPLQPVDSARVLARTLQDLAPVITARGAMVHTGTLPLVLADEGQLGQVFLNLVSNALKFTVAGAPEVRISAQPEAEGWCFAVADNGVGIPAEMTERVFDLFQRAKGTLAVEGSGIGLPLVRRIIQRHGGRIWLASTPERGTTVYFTLGAPASGEAA